MQKKRSSQKKISWKKASRVWTICATICFAFYVGFTLLNRFVLPQNVVALESVSAEPEIRVSDASTEPTEAEDETLSQAQSSHSQPIITQNSYTSDAVSITIDTIREYNTDIYVAEVKIEDSSLLRAGLAYGSFGNNLNQTTSEIAAENNAILAINGDYYGFRDTGYVMRNGQTYRDIGMSGGNEDLVIFENGSMDVIEETDVSVAELEEQGAAQIYSFGPGLIGDGEILVDETSEVEREDESNPRTAIGMIAPNHYIFLVADGRTTQSTGLSLMEMATVLHAYDCVEAYNLDGGGSATMVFMGELVNNPTTNGRRFQERSVSDIVYIGE